MESPGNALMSIFDAIAGCRPCDAIDRSKKRPAGGGRSPWTESFSSGPTGNSQPSRDAGGSGGREAGGRQGGGHAYGVPAPAHRELPDVPGRHAAPRIVVSPIRAARSESDYIAFGPQDVGGDLTCYGQLHGAWPHHAHGADGHGALGGPSARGLLSDFDHILGWPEVCQRDCVQLRDSARFWTVL